VCSVVIAHIGNIPVEEWVPFVVPVLALYLFGRRRERRRRKAVQRVLDAHKGPDEAAIARVLERWSRAGHDELSREHVALLYPPAPDGLTVPELATRTKRDPAAVQALLDDLAELGYVEPVGEAGAGAARTWLTAEGWDLANLTEDAVLAAFAEDKGVDASTRPAGPADR
jgi:hypothetical protein